MSGLTFIGYFWVTLSLIATTCLLIGFYVPHWIIGQISLNGAPHTVYLGSFRRCNYPAYDEVTQHFKIVEQCGTYQDLASIPSVYWQLCTVAVGIATFSSLVMALVLSAACCVSNVVNKRSAVLIGLIQVVSVSSGCILFPFGWDNQEVRDACGPYTGRFNLGECELGWAYVCILTGAALMLVCGMLSACGARPLRHDRWIEEKDILEPCRPIGRSLDAQGFHNNNMFVEDRSFGSTHSRIVRTPHRQSDMI